MASESKAMTLLGWDESIDVDFGEDAVVHRPLLEDVLRTHVDPAFFRQVFEPANATQPVEDEPVEDVPGEEGGSSSSASPSLPKPRQLSLHLEATVIPTSPEEVLALFERVMQEQDPTFRLEKQLPLPGIQPPPPQPLTPSSKRGKRRDKSIAFVSVAPGRDGRAPELLTTTEAANYCRFETTGGLRKAYKDQKIKPVGKRGGTGTWMWSRKELDRFLGRTEESDTAALKKSNPKDGRKAMTMAEEQAREVSPKAAPKKVTALEDARANRALRRAGYQVKE